MTFISTLVSIYFFTLLSGSASIHSDRLALVAFKAKIIDDPFDVMSSWNDTIHLCQWYGVTCGVRHQRVTQLSLPSLKLGGSISPHIGNLSFLHVLQLNDNNLVGQIPSEIGGLSRLQVLNLSSNTLGGEIPVNLSRCSQLRLLFLGENMLEGAIHVELGSLSKLETLSLYRNILVEAIPSSIGNLTRLMKLKLIFNNLTGQIPTTLGSLKHLKYLDVGVNYLHGEIPSSIFNLSSIEVLDLAGNQFSGRLPPTMFDILPNLVFFGLSHNQFTGPIPPSVSNASNLNILQLSTNSFTGKVPTLQNLIRLSSLTFRSNQLGSGIRAKDDLNFLCSLTNATYLLTFQMDYNNFGGMLPRCITNLSSQLRIFTMNGNHIYGTIPDRIDNLKGLQSLQVTNNSFTGIIPPTIGNLGNLVYLALEENYLSGFIPSSLGKLAKLLQIGLSYNSLQGTIPSALGNCTSLQYLDLSYNSLSGSIPAQILMPSLTLMLTLSNNHFTGSIPSEVGKLTNLNLLDVSANMLSGKIPDTLGECTSLEFLNLSLNTFQGSIPISLSSLRGLSVFDLSCNNLSGQIPQVLASLDVLIKLNLSFNHLQGPVPNTGVFRDANVTFLRGNDMLCGGIPEFHLLECTSSRVKKTSKLSPKLKATIAASVAGITCVGLLIMCVFGYMMKQRKTKEGTHIEHFPYVRFVSYGDIHRATSGFSEQNLIGMGSFGWVYRGTNLLEEVETVAIKVLKLDQLGASKSFVAECQALRNIRHKNLVKLLTVCSGVDYQGNEFKALVYELMPNGSLEQWLHPDNNEQRKLGFLKRLSIAIDTASVLEYVHHDCGPPLVHCDIKPSNILLDDDLSAHVSDFGLSKFLSSILPNPSSVGIRGTVGYAAPEYGLGSEVSTQGDVYSFGILLLEMFTGKRPTHEMFKDGVSLHLYAKRALEAGRVIDILDHLETEEHEVTLNPWRSARAMDCLVSIVEIGVGCSLESPSERMDISMAALQLRRIRVT